MENNLYGLTIPPFPLFQSSSNNKLVHSYVNSLNKIRAFEKLQEENAYLKMLLHKMLMLRTRQNQLESKPPLTCLPSIPKFETMHADFPIQDKKISLNTETCLSPSSDRTEDTTQAASAYNEKLMIKKEELECEDSSSSLEFRQKEDNFSSTDEEESCTKTLHMRRRNGFKQENASEINDSDRKSKISKQRRSRAKHLWVSYGRRIVEYAWKNTEGDNKQKIQACIGKLKSKKGYSEVFLVKKNDTQEEVEFKQQFGKLALEFIAHETEDSFLSSNYRGDFIDQKDKVAKWIACLISC